MANGLPVHHRRYFVLLVAATGLTIVWFLYSDVIIGAVLEGRPSPVLPVFYRDVWPNSTQLNIYQIETSSAAKIRPRFICSVESFCSLNPSAEVWLLVTTPTLSMSTFEDLNAIQAAHHNLRIAHAELDLILQDTPLANLYKSTKFWKTSFIVNQLSNTARMAVVYKSGGFYADTDILALRPVGHLRNFFALGRKSVVNNAVFHFQRGHPMLLEIMKYIANNYNGKKWGAQGPSAVTATAKSAGCSITPNETKAMNTAGKIQGTLATYDGEGGRNSTQVLVCDWTLLGESSFYPILGKDWKKLFLRSSKGRSQQIVEEIFPESYGVHLFNKITKEKSFKKGSLALKLASRSCPVIVSRNGPLL